MGISLPFELDKNAYTKSGCVVSGCTDKPICHHWGIGSLCRGHDAMLLQHDSKKTPEQRRAEQDFLLGRS